MWKWIEWYAQSNEGRYNGPLPDHALVQVMMLDGELDVAPAEDFNWGTVDQAGEIIAYRQIGWVANLRVTETVIHSGPSLEEMINKAMNRG